MTKTEQVVANLELTEKDLVDIHNAFCYLNHVKDELSHIVKDEYIKRLEKQINVFENYFRPILDEQDAREEENEDALSDIRDENDFISIWCVDSVSAKDMKKPCTLEFDVLSYYGIEIKINEINKPKTWLDVWKLCNELIVRSGHQDHIFIEVINVNNGIAEVYTGS